MLPLGRPVRWREYELTSHELPGHTVYATATELVVDGHRVVVTGDQQDGGWVAGERGEALNFQYRNGFHPDDYVRGAELYQRLAPELMISGHWLPRWVDRDYLDMLLTDGRRLAELHRSLLPTDIVDLGRFGLGTRITPYRSTVPAGAPVELTVLARNPLPVSGPAVDRPAPEVDLETVDLALVVPSGWKVDDACRRVRIAPGRDLPVRFTVHPPAGTAVVRARVGIDLTAGSVRFGQVAEALVDVVESER